MADFNQSPSGQAQVVLTVPALDMTLTGNALTIDTTFAPVDFAGVTGTFSLAPVVEEIVERGIFEMYPVYRRPTRVIESTPPPQDLLTVKQGFLAPVLGSGVAVDTTDWTTIVSVQADDAFVQTSNFGFAFTISGTEYETCFVSSNGYITFGSGSSAYASLSVTNPALNKLFFAAGDRNYRSVYTKSGVYQSTKYFAIRWEGSATSSGSTSNVIVEIYIYEQKHARQFVEVRFGTNSASATGMTLASPTAAYATGTSSADSSSVFSGNGAGTSWVLTSNRYILE
jgi:hypothetical protein